MFLLIVGFIVGVLVGYKYPQQVGQAMDYLKKLFNDLKNMVSKKETPPQS
jgi:Na+/H+-dicarboxylate symporter